MDKIAVERRYAPCSYIICRAHKTSTGEYDWNKRDKKNTILVQEDYDFVGVARAFGFNLESVQRTYRVSACRHSGTDGTVDCRECGAPVAMFISAARAYLDNCAENGTLVDDPGYFE